MIIRKYAAFLMTTLVIAGCGGGSSSSGPEERASTALMPQCLEFRPDPQPGISRATNVCSFSINVLWIASDGTRGVDTFEPNAFILYEDDYQTRVCQAPNRPIETTTIFVCGI